MNAICVLNLNSFLPTQCRASFQAAATRWQCEYIEIREPLAQIHHFWIKSLIPTSCYVTRFERVLQLDADVLIRSDCPSPFDLVPPGKIGVVTRVQPGCRTACRVIWQNNKRQADVFGVPIYTDAREHLNAGFILYNVQAHKPIMERWKESGKHGNYANIGCPEQLALSCILAQHKDQTHWLPNDFNRCHGHYQLPERGRMPKYIMHIHRPRIGSLAHHVGLYQWQLQS